MQKRGCQHEDEAARPSFSAGQHMNGQFLKGVQKVSWAGVNGTTHLGKQKLEGKKS